MTVVDRIKTICRERKIPLAKLERECGFANGYISQLRKGTMPADRMEKVAAYLGMTPAELMHGERDISAEIQDIIVKDQEASKLLVELYALPDDDRKLVADQIRRLREYTLRLKAQKDNLEYEVRRK